MSGMYRLRRHVLALLNTKEAVGSVAYLRYLNAEQVAVSKRELRAHSAALSGEVQVGQTERHVEICGGDMPEIRPRYARDATEGHVEICVGDKIEICPRCARDKTEVCPR